MFVSSRTELTWHPEGVGAAAVVVAEPAATYDPAPSSTPAPAGSGARTAARLGQVAALLDDRDRVMARVVGQLVAVLDDGGLAELTGGMSLHVWLQHTGRCTHGEARDLLGTADTLRHLPATCGGLADGWLSWSQVLAITTAARTVPVAVRSELDQLIADAMVRHRDWEPEALVADVWDWVDAHQPSRLEKAEAAAERGRVLTLSPGLFGGGSLYGELDPVGFATVAEALDAPLGPPVAPPDDLDDPDTLDEVFGRLDDHRRRLTKHHGRRLADRLVALCETDLAGGLPTADGQTSKPRPLLLATIDLHALLDHTTTPGWLLTTLPGGRMKLTTAALQRLVDQRGADLRSIVLDDCGRAVGVGRQTPVPPTWLRHAAWAQDLTVRDPDGATPIRRADLDHLVAFDDGGRTDTDNLHPLGRRWHNRKTRRHWTVHRARDGTTTWTHPWHGWTIRLAPPRRHLEDPPDPGPPRLPLDDLPPDLPAPDPGG